MKYREDLDLSEYVRSLIIAFIEAELLALEVRVLKAILFLFSELGARVFGIFYFLNWGLECLALSRMISLVNLKK